MSQFDQRDASGSVLKAVVDGGEELRRNSGKGVHIATQARAQTPPSSTCSSCNALGLHGTRLSPVHEGCDECCATSPQRMCNQ